jgi:RHH-type rel operon transcriptional repressor/antitoxin RelB
MPCIALVILMSTTVSFRLADEIVRELDELAVALERSKTYIIRKALESYLQEYADYLLALERLRDKDDEIISSDEMRGQFGLQSGI